MTKNEMIHKIARNIGKDTTLTIPARQRPSFKPSKEFLEMIDNNCELH